LEGEAMQLATALSPAELDALQEDAFRELGISDTTQTEPIVVPQPPPHTRIPEDADAEREAVGQDGPKPLTATPFTLRDPATLPLRDVLYGRHLIRGFVAGLVGIGGSGKSSLSTVENFARVSGKPLLGVKVYRPLRCWAINLEDPQDEIERRAQAVCLHYGLTVQDIGDRLFLDSGRVQPVVVARTLAGGARIIEPMVDSLIDEIKARKIDVLTIDPFVSSHEVPENDNGSIDLVIKKAWSAVAERAGCAVELVHHLRKIGDNEPTVDDARGAGAFMAGCRAVRVLAGMTKAEAERAGIENPYRYFRVFAGKLNMAPREDKSDWLFLESVDLGNQTTDRPSDHVQVAVPWQWPNALDGLATRDLFAVQKHIAAGQWRESAQSSEWVGKAVAEVLDLDLELPSLQARVKSLLKTWLESGALTVVCRFDDHRKERKFVEVGQWAID
jgi:AAA domain